LGRPAHPMKGRSEDMLFKMKTLNRPFQKNERNKKEERKKDRT
jgi:hypothetical protein